MDAGILLTIILAILVVNYLWEQFLDYLNLSHQQAIVPRELQDFVEPETYQRTLAYQKAKTHFGFITSGLGMVVMLAILLSGGFGWLDEWLRTYIEHPMILALAFFGALFLVSDILGTPFQWYHTFVLEEKFGFNKTTVKTFLLDKIKGYFLAILLGVPLLSLLMYTIMQLGANFWIYFLAVMAVFSLLINMFYTSWILPLFNKLTPLEDGDLKQAIEGYSQHVSFPLDNIFVIDGSKRSQKSNAFFSGLGKKKKIVLYDTLIENHDIEELVSILAHEVGHYKKKHIIQSYVLSILQAALLLFILSLMLNNQQLSIALGGTQWSMHLNLVAFGLLYTPVSKVLGVLFNILSRKNEFEADAYAAATSDGGALMLALKKLSVNNLSNLWPHKLFVFFHYSHPPLLQRLRALENLKSATKSQYPG